VHKINATKVVILVCNFNVVETLIARKSIQSIRHFKKIIVFRINNKSNKKTLESNDF